MDCVTPSHPENIPHGESLDVNQLLAKGSEAFLDPAIQPKTGPIDLDKYTYTPRASVMSTLNGVDGVDVGYIRAQITSDDKELKSIIKDAEKADSGLSNEGGKENDNDSAGGATTSPTKLPKAPRGRRPKPKVPIPPHAQPQRAMLMEVEDRWNLGYAKTFGGSPANGSGTNKAAPWLADKKSTSPLTYKLSQDGWEV